MEGGVSHLPRSGANGRDSGIPSIQGDSTTLASIANILVVDDEPGVRAYICGYLARRTSYRCIAAADPREALAAIRETTIDVALVDLSIGGEGGLALARRLREEVSDLPVVLVTGTQSFDVAVEAMRIGVLDYLLKPFAIADLTDAVERAVAWRREALGARSERASLLKQIAEGTSRLREAFSECAVASSAALEALLEMLNQRNPETLAHARRVSALSVAVAAELGIDDPSVGHIERGALLHDIGKIAIPDAVIHKPGPLTASEFAIMRSHVQIGYDIAVTVPFLGPAAEIVLATHERYDGTGYPRGLRRAAIPIGARIIAVVDAFDALTSCRVYRDPMCVDWANAEIVREAGSQFDPDVVAAWLRYQDRFPAAAGSWNATETLQ
jgi:putative nucleotidyltransferase with HDIG domain